METLSIHDAQSRLAELVAKAEAGETVVLTRNGAPVAEIVPAPRKPGGLRLEALAEFKKKHGIENIVPFIADDFDDPLPEDFLLRPLPPNP
jgi:prevent-host-death family protein